MIVSIIVPFLDEERTLRALVERVLGAPLPPGFEREVLLVDDGSRDGSGAIAAEFAARQPSIVRHLALDRNRGKGAAVRAGIAAARGAVCLVQDADLEYDPADYPVLLGPFADDAVQVVYGSRILGRGRRSYDRYYWGGRLLSWWTNTLFGSRITDEPTCYKVFRRGVVLPLGLRANGFEFCPELTAKLLRAGHAIHEVPVRYSPRTFKDGKKIRGKDGLLALWTLLRIRLGGGRAAAESTVPCVECEPRGAERHQ